MNALMKNLGVLILLVGVVVLAYRAFAGGQSNTALIIGLLLVIIGFFAHIFLNKKFE